MSTNDHEPADEDEAAASSIPPPTPTGASGDPSRAASAVPTDADMIASLKETISGLEDRVRRQQAEFMNDMRRIQRQADERVRFAAQPVVEDILGVADALHGAIEGLKDSEHEKRVAEGLHAVERQLLDGLGRHGVTRMDPVGKPFDPAFHQAILEVPSAAAERTVLQVVRPGFLLHGRVVRPAHVIVTRPPASAAPAEPEAKPAKKSGA
jgi:molecular chaperone GrpE